jgi:molybdopterin-containing oxidoreductase family iron-sulfur binding subunit
MSDSTVFNRRDFLKLVGIGVAGAAGGCAQPPADRLIPYLVGPNDTLPGLAYRYASTCRECPAGCGIEVKTREGRAIKIEGLAAHPLNRGGLCGRGQAGLQSLYDPDRVKSPMVREGSGWKPVSWDEALQLAGTRLAAAAGKVALFTDHAPGSFQRLAAEWASAMGGRHVVYEPFGLESLREANSRTFAQAAVPHYDFANALMLVSFGADFLETWIAPTAYARDFAAMRAHPERRFVAVEPRLSLTGANADEWVAARAGQEIAIALGMAHVILGENLGAGVPERARLIEAVAAWSPAAAAQQADVPAEKIIAMARAFAAEAPSLAVAGGIAAQSDKSVALHAAVNLLNYVAGNVGRTVRFDRTPDYGAVASFNDVQQLMSAMSGGGIDVLVVHGANPVYAVPAWAGFGAALEKVPFKIAIATAMDETAAACDLVLPASHAIESLGDLEPARGVYSIIQPAMQKLPMFDSKPAGEALIALAGAAGQGARFGATWDEYVKGQWRRLHARFGAGRDFDQFWKDCLRDGGVWEDVASPAVRWASTPAFSAPELQGSGDMALVLYPSAQLFDGRGANKPWLQELPDPTTKAVWGTWAEVHPETAAKIGVTHGQPLKITTEAGAVELPVYLYSGMRRDVVAVPLGQGHTAYGRYANDRGVNATVLLPAAQDDASGAIAYLSTKASLAKGTNAMTLVVTQRVMDQHDRKIAQIIPVSALLAGGNGHGASGGHGAAGGAPGHHEPHPSQTRPGKHTEPMERPEGYKTPAHAITAFESEHKVRSGRQNPVDVGSYKNAKHRWAMAIDIDRCTGCSACIVACNAENNVPMVGPVLIQRGREMQWIRLERWEEKMDSGRPDVRFVPMMCQHCGDAPCEIVCPVYATYHNPEGLNAQVYNRCVGTRYCSNNCPYKVRSFNWFDYAAPEKETFAFPEPLNWQLNPDVTVRSKGVMEKCTMCVQRILDGKGHARDESRDLRDGEINTACAQTCPTQAIVFGDLADPESRVSKLSHDERRYWVFNELNTKPGVTYLKKIDRGGEEHA